MWVGFGFGYRQVCKEVHKRLSCIYDELVNLIRFTWSFWLAPYWGARAPSVAL